MPRVRKHQAPALPKAMATAQMSVTRQKVNLRAIPSQQPVPTSSSSLVNYMFAKMPPRQDLWRNRYGRALNLDTIENSLRQADWGSMRMLTDLARETIDTDPHLAAVLNKRFGAISALPWEVVPAEGVGIDKDKARFYADVVRNQLKQLPDFGQRIHQLAWGLFDGRAALELEWVLVPLVPNLPTPVSPTYGSVNWMVKSVGWIHPRRIHFGPQRELRVYDDLAGGDFVERGIALQDYPAKFIYWTPQLFGDYPEREGLARRCLYWSFFKRFSARERMILLELFGKPWRWLEVGEDSTADRDDLANADDMLQNIGGNSSFRFPRGTSFKVEQPAEGAGDVHQETIEESDKQLSKLVLGQTGTTDANPAGLNNAQANVMQDEQFMILMRDASMVSDVFETHLTDQIIALNFGNTELNHAPHFRLRADVPLDREKELKRLKAAVDAGLEITLAEAYEVSGFRQPKEDEPVIKLETPPLHPMAVQPPPERPVIVYPESAKLPPRKTQPIAPAGEGGLTSPETRPPGQGGGSLVDTGNGNGNGSSGPASGGGELGAAPDEDTTVPKLVAEQLPGHVRTPGEVTAPFAGFDDFDGCLEAMQANGHTAESAAQMCGSLKRDYAAATATLHNVHPSDLAVIRATLLHAAACGCDGLHLEADQVTATQPEEAVVGSMETLISKGVKEGARQTQAIAATYLEAVRGLEDARAINGALQRANEDADLHGLSRSVERRILQGAMGGAIVSQYEFENDTVLPVADLNAALEATGGRKLLLAEGPQDPNFYDRPLQGAIQWFKSRNIVTRSIFDQLDAAAKRRAFTVAGMTNNLMLQRALDELEAQVRAGGQLRNFVAALEERFIGAGFTPANPSHVETVYRTNVLNAYNSGRHAQATQPSVLRMRPYWQIRTVNDGPPRQRKTHQKVHLWVLRADDSFWGSAYPPFGFNCRCRVVTLSEVEVKARSLRVRTGGEVSGLPDRGFVSGTSSLL